jgi:hypothetical protein
MNNLAELDLPVYPDIEIPANGSRYNYQDRYQAAVYMVIYGNTKKVAELTGIPRNTLLCWLKYEWWEKLINKLHEERSQEFKAAFSRLIDKSIKEIEKQLDNQEVKALDAAKIMGIAFDKRQIMNNLPTSIQGKSVQISDLAAEFERFTNAKQINQDEIEVSKTD